MALRFVDVAERCAPGRYPMKAHEEAPARIHRASGLFPEAPDVKRQGFDVVGLEVIFAHRAECGNISHGKRRFEDFVEARR